jgi:hypothetical protein
MKRVITTVTLSLLPSLMALSHNSSAASEGVLLASKAALQRFIKHNVSGTPPSGPHNSVPDQLDCLLGQQHVPQSVGGQHQELVLRRDIVHATFRIGDKQVRVEYLNKTITDFSTVFSDDLSPARHAPLLRDKSMSTVLLTWLCFSGQLKGELTTSPGVKRL